MSLTKSPAVNLFPVRESLVCDIPARDVKSPAVNLFPVRESLVCDIPARDVKIANLFFTVGWISDILVRMVWMTEFHLKTSYDMMHPEGSCNVADPLPIGTEMV
jgi:hypothetical protein